MNMDLGQHWTPQWLAKSMVKYTLKDWGGTKDDVVFDPSAGNGAFYEATKSVDKSVGFGGIEIDPDYVDDDKGIWEANFFSHPPYNKYWSIVVNPPFIRNHNITPKLKQQCQKYCKWVTGISIDGRAGLHFYFLIKSLDHLKHGGRMAFIMPADLLEGISAKSIWMWIAANYDIDAVVGFKSEVAPFPSLDVNVFVAFIKAALPRNTVKWEVIDKQDRLDDLISTDFSLAETRDLGEAIETGLSRPMTNHGCTHVLGDFVDIKRGIATGDNEFFFMTREQAIERKLDPDSSFFRRAIGRVRDVQSNVLRKGDMDKLDEEGRPTYLLCLTGDEELSPEMKDYIQQGEDRGLHEKSLIKQRNPWYKMEQREVPPFFFSYLGRSNCRFIKNKMSQGILPLTSFLCVYPKVGKRTMWDALNDERVIDHLNLVGKSYGSDSIKVEPKSLLQLPLPQEIVDKLKKD